MSFVFLLDDDNIDRPSDDDGTFTDEIARLPP